MGSVEHSYSAGLQLKDKAFFGVNADAVAGKFPAVVNDRYSLVQQGV
jgi:hypothetical protein